MTILLDSNLKDECVCKTQPVNVKHNATFIINLSEMIDPKDLMLMTWDRGSTMECIVPGSMLTMMDGFMVSHGKPNQGTPKKVPFITL